MKKFYLVLVNTLLITVANAQNVGIGTNNPTYKLDVVGDVNVNSGSGYRVNGSAGAGQYLRGDGTRFTPNTIQTSDVPAGSGHYIWNGTTLQAGDFRLSGNGSVGSFSIGAATPSASAILDVVASNKGVSFPNVDLQSNTDAVTIGSPKKGLVVYNTGATLAPSGLYINNGTPGSPNWQKLSDASGTIGTVSVTTPLTTTGGSNPTIGLGVVPVNLGGTGLTAVGAGQILIGNGSNTYINANLTGTNNQVNIASSAGNITLSTPQDIATSSNVSFNKATLNTATDVNSLEAGRSIKVGSTAQSAAAAGAGAVRYNGGNLEYSDGTTWKITNTNGSNDFIKNQTSQQTAANFNIDGSGKALSGYTWGTGKGGLTTDQSASLELGGSGQPYIDFDNGTGDFDARIQLTGDDQLLFDGTNVGIGASPGTTRLYLKGDGTNPMFTAVDNTNVVKVYVDPSGNVGINTNAPGTSLDVRTTDAVKMPSGTTAQRPASPLAGTTRFNTDCSCLEYYDGTNWISANATQVPIGTIAPYGGSTAPTGWLICDGSAVSRTTYNSLFAIIGTTYGAGDGSTTFNLPDLRGKTAFGLGTSAPYNSLGAIGGAITATPTLTPNLSVDIAATTGALPNHVHSIPAHSHGFSLTTPATNTGSEGAHTHNWGGNWSNDNPFDPNNDNGNGTGTTISDGYFWWGPGSGNAVATQIGTTTNGSHNHNLWAPVNDVNSSSSQGYPAGNVHNTVRSTDRGRSNTVGALDAAGDHSHTVGMYAHRHWIKTRPTTAGSAHLHSIPSLTVSGSVGSGASADGGTLNTGNNTTAPSVSIDPSPTAVTGTVTSNTISTANPYQVTNYIIKANNTGASSIVAANIPTGTFGQTLYYNSGWTATSNLYNNGTNVGIGATSPSQKLVVQGDYTSSTDAKQLLIQGNTNTNQQLEIGYQTNGDYASIQSIKQGSSAQPLALNPTGGNVGIGTASPLQSLSVFNSAGVYTGIESNTHAISAYTGTTANDYILYMGADKTNGVSYIQSVRWGTATERLILNGRGGNVGIGVVSPTAVLDVNGSTRLRGLTTAGVVKTDASGNLSSVATLGDADISALAWSKITGKPTTMSGFGITDGLTATNVNGTANRVAKFTGANTVGNSVIYDDGNIVQISPPTYTHFTSGTVYTQGGLVARGGMSNDIGDLTVNDKLYVTNDIQSDASVYWGSGLVRTETRDNAGLQGNAGARSGFYETSNPSNYYSGASSWQHMIDVRHSNNGNNFAMQFAGSFFDQRVFMRKTNNNPSTAWSSIQAAAQVNLRYGASGTFTTGVFTMHSSNAVDVVSGESYMITFMPDLRNTGGSGNDRFRLTCNYSGCASGMVNNPQVTTTPYQDHNNWYTYTHTWFFQAGCTGQITFSINVERFDSDDGWQYGDSRMVITRM